MTPAASRTRRAGSRESRRGSALLAVLWVSAALGMVAFALSHSVRSEFGRAALETGSLRAYYLAAGAIEATVLRMAAGPVESDPERRFTPGRRLMHFEFPKGSVRVEILAESGKLDVRRAPPEALAAVLSASGLEPSEAVSLAIRIVEFRNRRGQSGGGAPATIGTQGNLAPESTFAGGGASIDQLEDLLMLPGITPEVLYGTYRRGEQGELRRSGGLIHHLTTQGAGFIDANYASPEVLRAAGLDEGRVAEILRLRQLRPLTGGDFQFGQVAGGVPGMSVGIGAGAQAYTLRATAEADGGRARRTVTALIEMTQGAEEPVRIVRWYEHAL